MLQNHDGTQHVLSQKKVTQNNGLIGLANINIRSYEEKLKKCKTEVDVEFIKMIKEQKSNNEKS